VQDGRPDGGIDRVRHDGRSHDCEAAQSAAPIDRASELRARPEALETLARRASAVVIFHRGTAAPVSGESREPRLVRVPASTVLKTGVSIRDMSFLGLLDRTPLFGFELPEGADDLLPSDVRWLELVVASMTLSAEDSGLVNYIVGLANWRRTHVFCPRCGQAYSLGEGGHLMVCPSGHRSHPRIEPVVQMLVHDGERCLLARSPGWPPGWFSTLAGFVEAGETPEEATVREVREEARLDVLDVHYSGAQFFAGPYSLMLGFTARVADAAIATPGEELETVIAPTRGELRDMLADEAVKTPAPRALAGSLIDDWLEAPAD
jgi:NAD+ diphosphatase